MLPKTLHLSEFYCLILLLFLNIIHHSKAQLPTNGYTCTINSTTTNFPCQTYVLYRAKSPDFLDLASIADVFNVSRLTISKPSNISNPSSSLLPDQPLFIPISCGCHPVQNQTLKSISFANMTYTIKSGDTFYYVSSHVYGNLTTWESTVIINPTVDVYNLTIGVDYNFPIFLSRQSIVDLNGNNFKPMDTVFVPISKLVKLNQPPGVPTNQTNSGSNQQLENEYKKKLKERDFEVISRQENVGKGSERRILKQLEQNMLLADVSETLDKYKIYEIDELRKATDGFDERKIIQGSVYKGCIEGKFYAIKKMKWNAYEELKILQKVNHGNLVRLEGFSIDPEDATCYLVYEFIENGSLHSWLHENKGKLNWKTRLRISIDIANGLQYIHEHTRPQVVHKDIKSSNILLDAKMRAKIANFGLARSGCNAITMHIVGTQGYIAPEYLTDGIVSPKMDVFSFGVILLELLSGREAIDEEGKVLWASAHEIWDCTDEAEKVKKLMEWIDKFLVKESCSVDALTNIMNVAVACVNKDPSKRPSMVDVVYALCKSDDLFYDISGNEFSTSPITARDRAKSPDFLDLASIGDIFNPDDNLSSIASLFGVTRQSIVDVNGDNPKVFDTIFVPVSKLVKLNQPIQPPGAPNNQTNSGRAAVGLGVGMGVSILLLVLVSGVSIYTEIDYRKKSKERDFEVINRQENARKATDGFDEKSVIYGSVFKGCINGKFYAIKKMEWNAYEELKILQKTKLNWKARLRISIDIANGLQYFHEHTRPQVVHKDIKSSNILLDNNMRAKIANVGLARSGCNAITMHIVGTQGYIAPEYLTDGIVSPKMDVFSFGVVLLELLSGREAIDQEGKALWASAHETWDYVDDGTEKVKKLMEWIDNFLLTESCSVEALTNMMDVAVACVNKDPSKRPSMVDVVYVLCKSDDPFYDTSGTEFSTSSITSCYNSTEIINPDAKPLNLSVGPDDDLDIIASLFGVTRQSIADLNGDDPEVYETIFVPVTKLVKLNQPIQPIQPAPAPRVPTNQTNNSGSNQTIVVNRLLLVYWEVDLRKKSKERDFEEIIRQENVGHERRILKQLEQNLLLADVSDTLDKYKIFEIDELRKATDGFDERKVIHGSVYKGCIDGIFYAMKKMKWNAYEELKILQKVNHGNLVRLEGFSICPEDATCYLVYEYIENGSLHFWLHENKSKLNWKARLRISIDIANGLQYFHEHTRPQVVHKDIKSSNILLDTNMRAKIANFGLARSGCNAITMHIVGTQGYIAPEYLTDGIVSPKMDVFSFGVVLLELLSGREAIDQEGKALWASAHETWDYTDDETKKVKKLMEWIDNFLQTESCSVEALITMMDVAVACVNKDPSKRPSMVDVVYVLCKSDDSFYNTSGNEFSTSSFTSR
uniref:Protein kinase domain-containing protein n=1 Tax=Chenopodium quinoa TaxID=63459 RepID=A0A803LAB9_CHEQI